MRARSLLAIGVLATGLVAGEAALAPERAEACSTIPSVKPLRPRTGEQGIPTDAKIWIEGPQDTKITLSGNGALIETDFTGVPIIFGQAATPRTALAPNVEYTVTATSPLLAEPRVWTFTTGAGPQTQPLMVPSRLRVTASTTGMVPENSCSTTIGPLAVTIETEPVAGAALYQLEWTEEGRFTTRIMGTEPRFVVSAQALPTPVYRIRPIAMNGASVDAANLPSGSAAEPESEDDGGCSTTGAGAGAGLAVLLALGLVAGPSRANRYGYDRRRGISAQ